MSDIVDRAMNAAGIPPHPSQMTPPSSSGVLQTSSPTSSYGESKSGPPSGNPVLPFPGGHITAKPPTITQTVSPTSNYGAITEDKAPAPQSTPTPAPAPMASVPSAAPAEQDKNLDYYIKQINDAANKYQQIKTTNAAAQPDYVSDFLAKKQDPAQVFGNLVNSLGVGLEHFGGNNQATTRRQQAYNTALASQQEANKQFSQNVAQNNAVGNQVGADTQAKLQLLGPETQAAIAERIAPINPEMQAYIKRVYATLPAEIQLELAKTAFGLESQPNNIQGLFNTQTAGATGTAAKR